MSTEQILTQTLRTWVEVFMQRSFRDLRHFMEQAKISPSQVGAMMLLRGCGSCGVSDIGAHLGISAPAASQLVDRLVGIGLLERSEDPQDRRFKQVKLTPKGEALIEQSIQARQQWMEQLTHALTPAEQQIIIGALTLLTDAARKLEPQQAEFAR